ncbi:hypothetical protein KSP39_PZI020335 [Platanthera zijinensis]|uniref:Uncharacterized protein n=1 Tax=Platanthera zijinensis TaxID=2320716 RepID=A0AAP0FX55_9ASPA
MSLALLQGYSSAEEEQEERLSSSFSADDEDDEDDNHCASALQRNPSTGGNTASSDLLGPASNSSLPSVFAAFAEVVGPPEFLNNSVVDGDRQVVERDIGRRVRGQPRREKRELPPGAVIESKSQLVGIRDRVRADTEVSTPAVMSAAMNEEGKRIFSAANPDPKDAADLLRMCVQCGIPKTYSHARGVVCPVCGDRPLADAGKESEKKKGSTMKDKEKSKRMKGQSSHATWKSETEMHLRQQYD